MRRITEQNKAHFLIRSRYELKRRGETKLFDRQKLFRRKGDFPANKIVYITIKAPDRFKLEYDYCNEVIDFISRIKKIGLRSKSIFINLQDVIEIGEGAIAMLLSTTEELTRLGVRIKGNKPIDKESKDILEKSGFFNYVIGKVEDYNKNSKNTILKTGDKDTPRTVLSTEIKSAMDTVWGQKGRNPLVYSVAFEMMRNSCDHAFTNESNIRWHFAISHDDVAKRVKFSFVDNGKGIINTFRTGFLRRVLNLFKDDSDILETAFKDGIESRTGLYWRGKGLPTIYESYEESYMKNLLVISNGVFIHFDKGIKTTLNVPFRGTYYYWEVDTTCKKACFT